MPALPSEAKCAVSALQSAGQGTSGKQWRVRLASQPNSRLGRCTKQGSPTEPARPHRQRQTETTHCTPGACALRPDAAQATEISAGVGASGQPAGVRLAGSLARI